MSPLSTTARMHLPGSSRASVYPAIGVVAIAILTRAAIHASTSLLPRMDGGYYPLQARAVLRDGWLLLSDLPLVFWLQALVARALMLIPGVDLDRAVLLASKIVDSCSLPLAAIPIILLCSAWSARQQRSPLAASAGALFAVCSLPALGMVGDFQKNALGMVWFAWTAWAFLRALQARERNPWIGAPLALALAFPLLAAFTHVGALGATVIFVLIALVADQALSGRFSLRSLALGAAGALVVLLGVALLLSFFDAGRARYFLKAPAVLLARPALLSIFGGGPLFPPTCLYIIAVQILGVFALRRVLAQSAAPSPGHADRVLVTASTLTAMALCFPLMSDDLLRRYVLMSPIPLGFTLAYLIAHTQTPKLAWRLAAVATTLTLAPVPFAIPPLAAPIIPEACVGELRSLRQFVPAGRRTLVSARHGLEFWAGYFLDTDVRQDRVPTDAFAQHDRVFILVQTKFERAPFGPPDRPGGRGGPGTLAGPPGGGPPGWPGGPGLAGRGGAGPPHRELIIPPDATILHQGEYFTLAEVHSVPVDAAP